ncbi:MAG: hypothetical protein MZW92_32265 [Comamonadaceae bacterium]|nr:hypothetical protein [Comamonadaceae bacterium]
MTGGATPDCRGLDLSRLRVRFAVDGTTVHDKVGGHPQGDPIEPIRAYLARANDALGGLRADSGDHRQPHHAIPRRAPRAARGVDRGHRRGEPRAGALSRAGPRPDGASCPHRPARVAARAACRCGRLLPGERRLALVEERAHALAPVVARDRRRRTRRPRRRWRWRDPCPARAARGAWRASPRAAPSAAIIRASFEASCRAARRGRRRGWRARCAAPRRP